MIKNTIQWSIQNRFLVLLAMLFLVVAGIIALFRTPVDAIPDLSDVQVIIKVSYPGQAPQVVEDQVTYPLATAMLAVPKAVTVRGFSFLGDSFVYVIFEDGTDLYWARARVLEYLSQIVTQLPPEAKPELGPDATGVGWVFLYSLVDRTGNLDISELTSLQNWLLKFELQSIPGVSEVATLGGMVKQYQITLDPNRLRAYGLTLAEVKQALINANAEVGGSVVEMAEAEYIVRSSGYLDSIKSIETVPVGVNNNGTPILMKNIASINIGPEQRRGVAELNGEGETVGGIIVMRHGENALTVIDAVKDKLAELQNSLPEGVEIVTTYDRSSLIYSAIDTLKSKLLEETIVVILVCFIFLFHLRSSLVIAITLPLGILVAFIVMHLQGINANIMSLGGIAIAIGAMVDGAIVLIENIHKHLVKSPPQNTEEHWKLISKATLEVGPPIFFSLLIITLSFLPVFALQSQEGRLFTPLAFTKTYAMAASAALAITIVPVLMGYLIRGKILPEEKNPVNRGLINAYRPFIEWVLKKPIIVVFIAIIAVLSTYIPYSKLGSEFMPELDEGSLMYMPTAMPSLSIGKVQQLLQQTDKLIMSIPEVETVFGKAGRADTATDPAPLTMFETVITFKPKSEWRKGMTLDKIIAELDERIDIPGLANVWVMPIKTRIDMLATGLKTPVGIRISGDSLKGIQTVGKQIEDLLVHVPGTLSVFAERTAGGRYIQVDINRNEAARYGLNISDVQEFVSTAIGGVNVTETIEGRERYPINLRYPQFERNSLTSIQQLPLMTPSGAQIPLNQVANVSIVDASPMIRSENARLSGLVYIDIQNQDIGSYIEEAQALVKEHIDLPPGYTLTWTGQYEYMQRAKERLSLIAPFTFLIIFLLLYLNFKRFTEVFIILLTLPIAAIGGIWLLWLLNYEISVAVGVGFIALVGVAVELSIIMLVYLNLSLEAHQAKVNTPNLSHTDIREAVIEGALIRIRPITMTVATIVIGLLPIMLGSGTGSEVMRRIAAPMVGGMITATFLALFVIPAVFYLWKIRSKP